MHNGSFEQARITPDTFSERAEIPAVDDLKGYLFLGDRGYYSSDFILKLDEAGGYYILRAKDLKRALVHQAVQGDGKRLVNKKRPQLSQLQTRLPKKQLVDIDIEINGELVRLIAVWSPKEKRHTYLITNLNRQEFSAVEVTHIYRMRWQVELLFN